MSYDIKIIDINVETIDFSIIGLDRFDGLFELFFEAEVSFTPFEDGKREIPNTLASFEIINIVCRHGVVSRFLTEDGEVIDMDKLESELLFIINSDKYINP